MRKRLLLLGSSGLGFATSRISTLNLLGAGSLVRDCVSFVSQDESDSRYILISISGCADKCLIKTISTK